jgi:hypothetical protein
MDESLNTGKKLIINCRNLRDDIENLKYKVSNIEKCMTQNHINILQKIKYNDDLIYSNVKQIKEIMYIFIIVFLSSLFIYRLFFV